LLREPVEDTIRASTGLDFDVAGASFGLALAAGARCDCPDGLAARDLVSALIDYDHRVWGAEYARNHYHRSGMWRHAVDAAVADRVMSGEDAALSAHLDTFAEVGEELGGFLEQLILRAVDEAAVARLHEVWPALLDRLLPGARNLAAPAGNRDREPYPSHVEDLDRTLLLVPPRGANWPLEDTVRLGIRWFGAYPATPHVADKAIKFVARTVGVRRDLGVQMVLAVLGGDVQKMRRSSRLTVPWLQAVLSDPPPGQAATQARTLLDRLAATGDAAALAAQQGLEA
jgi:hypothetical protein